MGPPQSPYSANRRRAVSSPSRSMQYRLAVDSTDSPSNLRTVVTGGFKGGFAVQTMSSLPRIIGEVTGVDPGTHTPPELLRCVDVVGRNLEHHGTVSPPIVNTAEIGGSVPPTYFATQTFIRGARPYVPPFRRYIEDGAGHEINQI